MINVQLRQSAKGKMAARIQEALKKFDASYVTVGVHKEAGSYPAKDGGDGPTVAEVANWMEYGTDRVPARSFLQSTTDENQELLSKLSDQGLAHVGWGGWTVERALTRIGSSWLRAVQNKVKSNVSPPLGQSKGSARYLAWKLAHGMPGRTLIATGKLLGSLTYKVVLSEGATIESEKVSAEGEPETSKSKTGNAESRAAARAAGVARKEKAVEQRKTFAGDEARKSRFAAQQSTKGHTGAAHRAADKPHGKVR